MAFERYVHHISWVTSRCSREPKRNRCGSPAATIGKAVLCHGLGSTLSVHNKGSVVRIVLASGMVEVYDGVIPAYSVMEKYPGLCLTRPEVFKKPHESLVGHKEMLLPGQKYYLVPKTTVKKLRQNHPKKIDGFDEVRTKEVVSDKLEEEEGEVKCDGEMTPEYTCSAKDFFVSHDEWTSSFQRRLVIGGAEKRRRPFRPPIKMMRMRQGLLEGWKPSLPTVEEQSP